MRTQSHAQIRPRDGQALMELAMVLPIMIMLLLGAVDLARLFYSYQSVESAAAAGAQYGCQSSNHSTQATLIRSNAVLQAVDIGLPASNVSVNVISNRVVVTCSSTFRPVVPWPGFSANYTIQRSATMRIVPK